MAKTKPLPEYPKITVDELKKKQLCLILKTGGNKVTIWGMKNLYHFPYTPVFTHALVHLVEGDCLDVGFTTYIRKIEKILLKSKRYFAIELTDLTDVQKTIGVSTAMHMAAGKGKKFRMYDVWGFVAFGLRKIFGTKKIKGSKKYPFCSDQGIDLLQAMNYEYVMDLDSELISPCDIFLIFEKHKPAKIYEISVG